MFYFSWRKSDKMPMIISFPIENSQKKDQTYLKSIFLSYLLGFLY